MPSSVKIVPKRLVQHPIFKPLVVTLVYEGLSIFDFACAFEVFGPGAGEAQTDWYRFETASTEPGPFRARGGLVIGNAGAPTLLHEAGTIIIPGWGPAETPVPEPLRLALRSAYAAGARLMSLASGTFVLAATGLLDGREATTHWCDAKRFTECYPRTRFIPDVPYVDAGNILTGAGSAAGLDLCLHLVRRDWGPEVADRVGRRFLTRAQLRNTHPRHIRRSAEGGPAIGSRLRALQERVRNTLEEVWTIERLAREASISSRALHRNFHAETGRSPGVWLNGERVNKARVLLESTEMQIADLATMCGFRSVASLRHHFRNSLGTGPVEYRLALNRSRFPS